MSRPPDGPVAAAAPVLWAARPEEDPKLAAKAFTHVVADELGMPGLVDSEWRALAEHYAPQLWIETGGDYDRPAAPRLGSAGAEADAGMPLVNYEISFTRFGGQVLSQISYFVWFKAGAATPGLDGLIWRVTLDSEGQALVYESLHQSGRDHRWFPVQPMTPRPVGYWQDPPLIADALAPPQAATLRLRSGTHELSRVVAAEQAGAQPMRQYELRPYEELFTLRSPGDGSRSLFDADGRVRGNSQQPQPLRQYGHHPIAHIGRAHFDDPFLLESVFIPGPPPDTQLSRK
jgi:hypothetical protein